MRGADTFTKSLFTMRHRDDFVPANHPLRTEPDFQIAKSVLRNSAHAGDEADFAYQYFSSLLGQA